MTSGNVFNICDADWSSHFDTLFRRVVSYDLSLNGSAPEGIHEILSVTVNGQEISPHLYRLQNSLLKLNHTLFQAGQPHSVQVEYSYQ